MANRVEHRDKNSKRKKILVAVLLAIFLVVVVLCPTSQTTTEAVTGAKGACAASPPTAAPPPIAKSTPIEQTILPLPKVDLQQVLALDPFRSRPLGDPQVDTGDKTIASESPLASMEAADSTVESSQVLQIEIPISAIVTGGKRSAALIGDKLFYENDLLENGWFIVAIKQSSILVERAHN